MKNSYELIIVGAGPAGLFAALYSSARDILILEKMESSAKKLLISGNGQCNLTHDGDIKDFLNHYGDSGRFLKHALFSFTNKDIISFFEERGISFISNSNGKIFPASLKSSDILNVILNEIKKKNVPILYKSAVKSVSFSENLFVITTQNQTFYSKKIIIATGGKSYPKTGSTGDGQKIAEMLGHSIEPLKPALTPIFIKDFSLSELTGNSLENIEVLILNKNKKPKKVKGDLLITEKGFSGPVIIDNSRDIEEGVEIVVNFAGITEESFKIMMEKTLKEKPETMLKTALKNLGLTERLIKKLIFLADLSPERRVAEIGKKGMFQLLNSFVKHRFKIDCLGDFSIAMATKGGVSKDEINFKTMESKIVPGLFFAGEVIDIDGDSGGYNIQAAISTGVLAGKNAAI